MSLLLNSQKRNIYIYMIAMIFPFVSLFSFSCAATDSSYVLIRNKSTHNPMPRGMILPLDHKGNIEWNDRSYVAPKDKRVTINNDDILGQIMGKEGLAGRIFGDKDVDKYESPFRFDGDNYITVNKEDIKIETLTIWFDFGPENHYESAISDPAENGEQYIGLKGHCLVNEEYNAFLTYEINQNSRLLIKSVKFDISSYETPGIVCNCLNNPESCDSEKEKISSKMKTLKFKNGFEDVDNQISKITVYAVCGNQGEKIEISKYSSKNDCIIDKGETCDIQIPDMDWKNLVYTFYYNSKRIDGKETKVKIDGEDNIILDPFPVLSGITEIGNNNLPGEKLGLSLELVNNSRKVEISYSFNGSNKTVVLQPKTQFFTLQDYYGDITNLMVDGKVCKVSNKEIVRVKTPTIIILDLNGIGTNRNQKKSAGFYSLVDELYDNLSKKGVHFYKYIIPPVDASTFNRFKIRNIHVNHPDIDEYETVNKAEYKGFIDYLEESELIDTKSRGESWNYYYAFEPINGAREIVSNITPNKSEDMGSKRYLIKFTDNVFKSELIPDSFFNIYYISYDEYSGKTFIDKNDNDVYDEDSEDMLIQSDAIKYLSLKDKDSDDEDPKVISIKQLLEQID